jgi:hypothetical protein
LPPVEQRADLRQVFRAALKELDRSSATLLLLAACMPVIYVYQGVPQFFVRHLAPVWVGEADPLLELYAQLWRFGAVFILFFVLPALAYRLVVRRPLADLGLRLGDWRAGLRVALPALALLLPALWLNSAAADFQAEYPMAKVATRSATMLVAYELAYGLYYWGWEFLFRGALQLGLKARLGVVGAGMVQLLPSVLLHIGKPVGETWSAVLAAPLFGALAVRTGSFLPLFLLHYLIGVQNDLFCAARQGLIW